MKVYGLSTETNRLRRIPNMTRANPKPNLISPKTKNHTPPRHVGSPPPLNSLRLFFRKEMQGAVVEEGEGVVRH